MLYFHSLQQQTALIDACTFNDLRFSRKMALGTGAVITSSIPFAQQPNWKSMKGLHQRLEPLLHIIICACRRITNLARPFYQYEIILLTTWVAVLALGLVLSIAEEVSCVSKLTKLLSLLGGYIFKIWFKTGLTARLCSRHRIQ